MFEVFTDKVWCECNFDAFHKLLAVKFNAPLAVMTFLKSQPNFELRAWGKVYRYNEPFLRD